MQIHAVACIDVLTPCPSMQMKLRWMNVGESNVLLSFLVFLSIDVCSPSSVLILNVSSHFNFSCVAGHICRGAGGADGVGPISRRSGCCRRE